MMCVDLVKRVQNLCQNTRVPMGNTVLGESPHDTYVNVNSRSVRVANDAKSMKTFIILMQRG